MGLQLVVKASTADIIESALGDIAPLCEVFPMSPEHFGVSIPSKVLDSIGESVVRNRLEVLNCFDLWEGVWKYPNTK